MFFINVKKHVFKNVFYRYSQFNVFNIYGKYKVRADIRGGSLGRGRQTTLGVVDDGYFLAI